MKKGIHPEYYPQAKVICACGNTWTTGSTKPVIHTDVCSACHPFFTGEQRIVDAEGHVERFIRRLERSEELKAARAEAVQEAEAERVASAEDAE
jgi:large subunit ribosomal protein L31